MTIYKITNLLNNKIYIGQTTEKDPYSRISKHFNIKKTTNVSYINRAIKKYGKENFKVELLDYALNIDQLNELEKKHIKEQNALVPNGYNLKKGGEQGGSLSESTKRKISEKNKISLKNRGKGIPKSEAHKKAMSLERKGKPQTEGRIKAMRERFEKYRNDIVAINLETLEEIPFRTIEECAKTLNLQSCNISRVLQCKQNRTQHKGWTFRKVQNDLA